MAWGNTGSKVPLETKIEWAIRYNMLGEKVGVAKDVEEYRKANGMTPLRHAAQSFSHVKTDIEHGIKNGNQDILDLCALWGIDVTKPLSQQNRNDVSDAWKKIKASRQPHAASESQQL